MHLRAGVLCGGDDIEVHNRVCLATRYVGHSVSAPNRSPHLWDYSGPCLVSQARPDPSSSS